jgi:hypothetical protein
LMGCGRRSRSFSGVARASLLPLRLRHLRDITLRLAEYRARG